MASMLLFLLGKKEKSEEISKNANLKIDNRENTFKLLPYITELSH